MGCIGKGIFATIAIVGLVIIGLALFGMQQMKAYEAMSPAERAAVDREVAARAEADRIERLKGTDCEKLDALACHEMRRQRESREAAARAWEKSDLKKAYDDAGVR